jgi:two-component system CheB/CheR fusion protein
MADHEGLFSSRGVDLREEIPPGPVYVSADPVRLSQIVGNLLQNAAQFTPSGGHAVLALEVGSPPEAAARIRVRDSGIGLEPGIRERLFLPFSQADTSLARTAGGLGLGLALAKSLVDLHGGNIQADSAGPGLGTTFTVELPLLEEAAKELGEPSSRPQLL